MPIGTTLLKSASSRMMFADLPPSSRKTRFIVAAPFSMIRLPVTVEPVNEIMSTRGDSVSSSPTRWSLDVTTLNTPAGMSVFSATSRPRRVAFHGVSGAGLSTHVFPVARIWAILLIVTSNGKFHGTIAPTTPIGSFHTQRCDMPAMPGATPMSRSHSNSSIMRIGYRIPSASGPSSWAM